MTDTENSAMYQWVIIVISKQAAAASAGRIKKPEITTTASSDHGRWRSKAIAAAIAIGNLMREQCLHWGTDHFPVIVLQPVTLALLTLLEDLESQGNLSVFATLCIVIQAVSKRFHVARGVIHLAHKTVKQKQVMLPPEVERLLDVDQADISSDLVPQVDDIGIDFLLAKWVDLEI